MATAVVMPRQGNTVESCVILSWKKQPGAVVAAGDVLCEVETDKAVFEVPAPEAGTLLECFFPAGADVPVLTNIAAIGAPGESAAAMRPQGAAAKAAVPGAADAAAPAPAAAAAPPAAAAAGAPPAGARPGRLRVSPRARRMASERGVDPAALAGSGPGGRVIVRDVIAAAAGAAPAAAAPAAPAPAPAAPLRGVRKLIAERMLAAVQTTAHFTLNASADARRILELRRRFKESPAEYGLAGVTVNDLVMFAVTRVLPRHPEINATFADGVVTRHAPVHLGFAVDTERGLMVPVIRDAQALGLAALSRAARRLAEACVKGGVSPDDLAGGTFTVTNLGSLGVETFTPVLNPPQVAILGVGAVTLRAARGASGDVDFVDTLGLSLTIDHQVVDGAPAARFLQALGRAIAEIDLQLAV